VFPRDMVCLRNIIVGTLHKGDTEDNNNNIRVHKFYNNLTATSKFWAPEGHMQQDSDLQFQNDL